MPILPKIVTFEKFSGENSKGVIEKNILISKELSLTHEFSEYTYYVNGYGKWTHLDFEKNLFMATYWSKVRNLR